MPTAVAAMCAATAAAMDGKNHAGVAMARASAARAVSASVSAAAAWAAVGRSGILSMMESIR